MKPKIHPKYVECHATCSCGNTFTTRSTQSEIKVDICSQCHPFFTGRQKLVDSAGRVEKFRRRYGLPSQAAEAEARPPEESGGEASSPEAQPEG